MNHINMLEKTSLPHKTTLHKIGELLICRGMHNTLNLNNQTNVPQKGSLRQVHTDTLLFRMECIFLDVRKL